MAFSNEDLEYKLLTGDKVDVALQLQTLTMHQENVAIGVGMFDEPGAPAEMSLVFREVIKDGATLIAVDRKTGKLAAVAFNKIHARPREDEEDQLQMFVEKNLRHRTCRELIKFLDNIEGAVDIFERYNADAAMELFYLATDPHYQGRGIGRQMVQKCIEFCRGLSDGTTKRISIDGNVLDQHAPPQFIYGVFASNYSQSIADKLGFVRLNEVHYDDYTSAGRRMSERIGIVHKSAKLQVLKL